MEIATFWFFGALIVGIIASAKGRSGFGYFLVSLFLTPILIGILVLVLPSLIAQSVVASGEVVSNKTHVRCPDCRELVRFDATKCKHCSCALIAQKL